MTFTRRQKRNVIVAGFSIFLALSIVVAVLFMFWPRPAISGESDKTPVATSVAAPDDAATHTFYSFGHTSASLFAPAADPQVIEQRIPFSIGVPADSYRVHIENIDYLQDARLGDITVHSIYIGSMGEEGIFQEHARLSGEAVTKNSALSTQWFDQSVMKLEPGTTYLLGISFSVPNGTQIGVAPGVGWIRQGIQADPMVVDGNLGTYTRAGTFLDVSLDYTFDDHAETTPVVAVFGHSLNNGANQNPEVPHHGETSAWHQLWAREHQASAASFGAAGSWTSHFAPDSPKWDRATDVDADIVTVWASSSDLVSGMSLNDVGSYWTALIAKAKATWPEARIVAFTEPPRGADGEGEMLRREWNNFLRSHPDQIDALVDSEALLEDPANPGVLSASIDGDGSHFAPAGHQLIADAFAEAVASLPPRP